MIHEENPAIIDIEVSALEDQESVSDLYVFLAQMTAAIGFAAALIRLINDLTQRRKVIHQYSSSSNIKIIRLRRRASGTNLWKVVKVMSIISSLMMLSLLGVLIYATIKSGILFEFSPSSVFLLALMIGLPLYLLVSINVDERKIRRGIGSRVAERAELELSGDYKSMMERCQQALSAMGARIVNLDTKQGAIEAELKESKVTIQITETLDMHCKMLVVSDAILPSVLFDLGKNKRIVDDLIKRL